MINSFAPRDGKCEDCGETRSLKDGLCHECTQAEIDASNCAECNLTQSACVCEGGPWIPGGYRL
jgi:hypothetical protein